MGKVNNLKEYDEAVNKAKLEYDQEIKRLNNLGIDYNKCDIAAEIYDKHNVGPWDRRRSYYEMNNKQES